MLGVCKGLCAVEGRRGKGFFTVVYMLQEFPLKEAAHCLKCCFECYLQQTRKDCLGSVNSSKVFLSGFVFIYLFLFTHTAVIHRCDLDCVRALAG